MIPSDRLLMLIGFIGQDLLQHMRKLSQQSGEREGVEITGEILGGKFKVQVWFDSEVEH